MQIHHLHDGYAIITYSDGTAALCSRHGVIHEYYMEVEHVDMPRETSYNPAHDTQNAIAAELGRYPWDMTND